MCDVNVCECDVNVCVMLCVCDVNDMMMCRMAPDIALTCVDVIDKNFLEIQAQIGQGGVLLLKEKRLLLFILSII